MRKLIILAVVAALATLACVPAAMAAGTKTTVTMTGAFLGNGQSFWSRQDQVRQDGVHAQPSCDRLHR